MDESYKQRYFELLRSLSVPDYFSYDLLFDFFQECQEGAKDMRDINATVRSFGVNPVTLTLYIVHEHAFHLGLIGKSEDELKNDEKYHQLICSLALDKYYTNEHLAYHSGSFASRFNPTISNLDLYLNFILGMLNRYRRGDPKDTLIVDIMTKGFQMAKCVSSLLENGFETEAFSTWRTLHENECILQVIVRYGKPVIDEYLKHMKYAVAFRNGLGSKEETDECFVQIKEEMKALGLKSKDMKRFIEYGWLLGIKDVMQVEGFKFNFRDGVERCAGLSNYSKNYEMSSEIAHSSPLLIYSNKEYLHHVCLLNLYESFFRLEKIFTSLYMSTVNQEQQAAYVRMRNLYQNELRAAYEFETHQLQRLNKNQPRKSGGEPPETLKEAE